MLRSRLLDGDRDATNSTQIQMTNEAVSEVETKTNNPPILHRRTFSAYKVLAAFLLFAVLLGACACGQVSLFIIAHGPNSQIRVASIFFFANAFLLFSSLCLSWFGPIFQRFFFDA